MALGKSPRTIADKLRIASVTTVVLAFGGAAVDFLLKWSHSDISGLADVSKPEQIASAVAKSVENVFRHAALDLFLVLGGLFVGGLVEYFRGKIESEAAFQRLQDKFTSDVTNPVKQLSDHVDNNVECRHMGAAQKVIDQITERIHRAEEVKNTFILFGLGESDAYASKHFGALCRSIKDFLAGDHTWEDIVSQDVTSSPTKGWLIPIVDLHKVAFNTDKKKTDGQPPAGTEQEKKSEALAQALAAENVTRAREALERYKLRRLKESYPVINFMLLRYATNVREVIFGWGHHSEDPTGNVFVSRNSRLLDTFDQYWKVLEKDSVRVHHFSNGHLEDVPELRPVTASEITGLWVRVSYYVTNDWNACDGVPPGKEIYDVALVNIRIEENRKLVIEGRRFHLLPNGLKRVHGYRAKAADLEEFRLWFATTTIENLLIAGWYRFVPGEEKIWKPNVRIRDFYGEFGEYKSNGATPMPDHEPSPERLTDPISQSDPQSADKTTTKHETSSELNLKVGRLILFGTRVRKEWMDSIADTDSDSQRDSKSDAGGKTDDGTKEEKNTSDDFLDHWPNAPEKQIKLVERCLTWWNTEGRERWQFGISKEAKEQSKRDKPTSEQASRTD